MLRGSHSCHGNVSTLNVAYNQIITSIISSLNPGIHPFEGEYITIRKGIPYDVGNRPGPPTRNYHLHWQKLSESIGFKQLY